MNISISPYMAPGVNVIITEEKILSSVMHEYRIKKADMFAKTRVRRVVEPRSVAMTIIKIATKITVMETGKIFDKDHSTITYAMKTVGNLYSTNRNFQKRLDRIINDVIPSPKQKYEFYNKLLKRDEVGE